MIKEIKMRCIYILMLLVHITIVSSCDSEEMATDKALENGNIVGFVDLVDINGRELSDKSGVLVSLEDSSLAAQTDKGGRFEIQDVPAGTYDIVYSKEGYGTYRTFSFQFAGGENVPGIVKKVKLYEKFSLVLDSLGASYANNSIEWNGVLTNPDDLNADVHFFISTEKDVSYNKYDHAYRNGGCCFTNNYLDYLNFKETDFNPGQTVYIQLYFKNNYEEEPYYDHDVKKDVYASYSEAYDVFEITLEEEE